MMLRECPFFNFRFLSPIALCGSPAFFISPGGGECSQKRKCQETVTECRAAVDVGSDPAFAYWGLARRAEKLERSTEALAELRETSGFAPENTDAKTGSNNYHHCGALFTMTETRLAIRKTDSARVFLGVPEKHCPNYLKTRLLKNQTAAAGGNAENAFCPANDIYGTSKGIVKDPRVLPRGPVNLQLGKFAESKADLPGEMNLQAKKIFEQMVS